jgi:hypothetical protein
LRVLSSCMGMRTAPKSNKMFFIMLHFCGHKVKDNLRYLKRHLFL